MDIWGSQRGSADKGHANPPHPPPNSMNIHQPALPQNLRSWQQNIHKFKMAQSYVLNTINPKDWDIIALQELWFDSFSNMRGTQYWRVIYPTNFYVEGWVL